MVMIDVDGMVFVTPRVTTNLITLIRGLILH
jgi:hypothetical protein